MARKPRMNLKHWKMTAELLRIRLEESQQMIKELQGVAESRWTEIMQLREKCEKTELLQSLFDAECNVVASVRKENDDLRVQLNGIAEREATIARLKERIAELEKIVPPISDSLISDYEQRIEDRAELAYQKQRADVAVRILIDALRA